MLINKKVESYHLTLIIEQKLCLPVIKLESNNYICQFFILESSPKGKRKLEFIEKKKTKIFENAFSLKPLEPHWKVLKLYSGLTGKTIFLDIKEARIKQRIEADILKLGAVSQDVFFQSPM